MTAPHGPAIDRVAAVATDLGDLATRVVFIGGAIAPLLQTDPPFARARVTSDVDGVVASSTYAESERLHGELTRRGFRQAMGDTKHVHRWIAPSGIPFDLVPAGEHLGGSVNPWDVVALETAVEVTIGGGVTIRHVSAANPATRKIGTTKRRDRSALAVVADLDALLHKPFDISVLLQAIQPTS